MNYSIWLWKIFSINGFFKWKFWLFNWKFSLLHIMNFYIFVFFACDDFFTFDFHSQWITTYKILIFCEKFLRINFNVSHESLHWTMRKNFQKILENNNSLAGYVFHLWGIVLLIMDMMKIFCSNIYIWNMYENMKKSCWKNLAYVIEFFTYM